MTKKQIKHVFKCTEITLMYYPKWRVGQCFFNSLHREFPEYANKLRGTKYDPFYYNEVKDETIQFLMSLNE